MAKFIATHGVHLADLGIAFKYDAEATGANSTKVYSADLGAKDAAALKKLDAAVLREYGITEGKGSSDAETDASES